MGGLWVSFDGVRCGRGFVRLLNRRMSLFVLRRRNAKLLAADAWEPLLCFELEETSSSDAPEEERARGVKTVRLVSMSGTLPHVNTS